MRENESIIMSQSPLVLSEESKTFKCDLWEKQLNELNETIPTKIRELIFF